jgi:hypothetical protein
MTYVFIYLLIGVAYSLINIPVMKEMAEERIEDDNARNKALSLSVLIITLTWPVIIIHGILS